MANIMGGKGICKEGAMIKAKVFESGILEATGKIKSQLSIFTR